VSGRRRFRAIDHHLAPVVHQDGGTDGVQPVLEEAEVVPAPEQRTALQQRSLDQRTSRAAVTPVSSRQGPGGLLVERSLHLGYPFATAEPSTASYRSDRPVAVGSPVVPVMMTTSETIEQKSGGVGHHIGGQCSRSPMASSSAICMEPDEVPGVGLVISRRMLDVLTCWKLIVDGALEMVAQSACRPLTETHPPPFQYDTRTDDGSERVALVVKYPRSCPTVCWAGQLTATQSSPRDRLMAGSSAVADLE